MDISFSKYRSLNLFYKILMYYKDVSLTLISLLFLTVRLAYTLNFSSPDAEMATAGGYFDGQQLITA